MARKMFTFVLPCLVCLIVCTQTVLADEFDKATGLLSSREKPDKYGHFTVIKWRSELFLLTDRITSSSRPSIFAIAIEDEHLAWYDLADVTYGGVSQPIPLGDLAVYLLSNKESVVQEASSPWMRLNDVAIELDLSPGTSSRNEILDFSTFTTTRSFQNTRYILNRNSAFLLQERFLQRQPLPQRERRGYYEISIGLPQENAGVLVNLREVRPGVFSTDGMLIYSIYNYTDPLTVFLLPAESLLVELEFLHDPVIEPLETFKRKYPER